MKYHIRKHQIIWQKFVVNLGSGLDKLLTTKSCADHIESFCDSSHCRRDHALEASGGDPIENGEDVVSCHLRNTEPREGNDGPCPSYHNYNIDDTNAICDHSWHYPKRQRDTI